MADLQQTRWDKLIRRVGNIVGVGAIVTETLQEVFPIIDLENVPSELLVLAGWNMALRGTDITAGAAQVTASQLFNPANSGMVMAITSIILSVSITDAIGYRLDSVQLASSNGFGQYRDARAGAPTGQAALGNTRIETPKAITPIAEVLVAANTPYTFHDPNGIAVLMPGNGFTLGTQINNNRFIVGYWWRERRLEAAEIGL